MLDKKLQVLLNELTEQHCQAIQAKANLSMALNKAYMSLKNVQKEMSPANIQKVCQTIQKNASINICFSSIMGVDLPLTSIKDSLAEFGYSLHNTTVSFDEAVLAWKEACRLIIVRAGIENTIHLLKTHIKKTQKRANALGNITIPKYEARIKYIQERLEERERDDLARLKLAKNKTLYPRHQQ